MTTSIAEVVLRLDSLSRENEVLHGENAALRIRVEELTAERDDLSARLHGPIMFGGPW